MYKSLIILLFFCSIIYGNEPTFIQYKSVKLLQEPNVVLRDIYSHLNNNLGYTFDNLGNAHEYSHLINGEARSKLGIFGGEVLYCLNDRVAVLNDVSIKIKDVEKIIPNNLRGVSNLYLTSDNFSNKNAVNLFNEWVAYTNGATYGLSNNDKGVEFELQHAVDFNVYCVYVIAEHEKRASFSDVQLIRFYKWNVERVSVLRKQIKSEKIANYLKNAGQIEDFVINYYGTEWYNNNFLP